MLGAVDRHASGLAQGGGDGTVLAPMLSVEAVGLLAVTLMLGLLMARELLLAYVQQERLDPRRRDRLERLRGLLQALTYPSLALLVVFIVLAGIEYANAL